MSVVSLPVTRPAGRVLVIANPSLQPQPMQLMERLGFECHVSPDPYAAMAELCTAASPYRAAVLSLQSFFREEMPLLSAIKRRLPQLEIWLTHTDGRQAALAEAMRMGADGLLAEDGLHRIAAATAVPATIIAPPEPPPAEASPEPAESAETQQQDEPSVNEPVLTAD